ncbi:arginyltransferase [Alkalicaulis satelles]|uniref:Aspartate/glutamate leucyltransferase n=1 Tax=Alkalicaulis satelles TaxID=2609175 RepID=A0A5M6ZKI2_9PROT|nr:arginyltransferase [Alkalicaulis satelles]KAA5804840.1 arginyltransferase [Alkalicaulis satelles]
MTRPFTTRQLPFFLTAPSPCPYLPGRQERKVFTRVDVLDGPGLNDTLTHAGFRRSQSILYRPACERCAACKSARIPAEAFEPSRNQRRILKRNSDLLRLPRQPEATPEQYALLSRYLEARHSDGDMAGMDFFDFSTMVEEGAARTELVEYRDSAGVLVACALTDRLQDGYSLVYSFFEPGRERDSLGAFIILDHVARAREARLPYVYLGYWVQGSRKMDYKARYHPLEVLEPSGWRMLAESDRLAAPEPMSRAG